MIEQLISIFIRALIDHNILRATNKHELISLRSIESYKNKSIQAIRLPMNHSLDVFFSMIHLSIVSQGIALKARKRFKANSFDQMRFFLENI